MTQTPNKKSYECPFRESFFCTFGHSGSVITIEEDYNENGIIACRASVGSRNLKHCDVDDCPLKHNDNAPD